MSMRERKELVGGGKKSRIKKIGLFRLLLDRGKNRGPDVVRGKADRKLLPKDAVTFFSLSFLTISVLMKCGLSSKSLAWYMRLLFQIRRTRGGRGLVL